MKSNKEYLVKFYLSNNNLDDKRSAVAGDIVIEMDTNSGEIILSEQANNELIDAIRAFENAPKR